VKQEIGAANSTVNVVSFRVRVGGDEERNGELEELGSSKIDRYY
jgi:hypothetical protein